MEMNICEFVDNLNTKIVMSNKLLNEIVHEYSFVYISEKNQLMANQKIFQNIQESKIIIFDQNCNVNRMFNEKYLFMGFYKTIIIIKESSLSFLQPLFAAKSDLSIYFLSNTKDIFNNKINVQYNESNNDSNFEQEIKSFNNKLLIQSPKGKEINYIWLSIKSCISGYLIKESYMKLNKNRFEQFSTIQKNKSIPKIMNEKEFIILREVGIGSIFCVKLIYDIKSKELYAMKIPHIDNSNEISKLIKRETNNYKNINHPLLPTFIGTTEKENFIITEFINGDTLIKKNQLAYDEKITIIFEIMLVVEFLHRNNFIIRDLKPDNIMIDQNNTVVLIDFDRMIKSNEVDEDQITTNDLSSNYLAPEVNSLKFTKSIDIYSIGKIIYFIMKGKIPTIKNSFEQNPFDGDIEMQNLYLKCINENPLKRPEISQILFDFCDNYHSLISINNFEDYLTDIYEEEAIEALKNLREDENNANSINFPQNSENKNKAISQNIKNTNNNNINSGISTNQNEDKCEPQTLYLIGINYINGYYGVQDTNKAIYYFNLAAEKNCADAQFALGSIYYLGEDVPRNLNKAFHYLSLSANQGHPKAQLMLGYFYENGFNIHKDIDRAIHYYSLAAEKNDNDAQFILGTIYFYGKYGKQDIKKAIHYLTLSANKNDPRSQSLLGYIYERNSFVDQDINKALNYYKSSAAQNNSMAQYNLGLLYLTGQYVPKDMNKAINYFESAANQNSLDAQLYLGDIYSDPIYGINDMKKAIYYYKLASNQNNEKATYNLAKIYYSGLNVPRDINKAIHYFQLSANQNFLPAFTKLGEIYYKGKYVTRDVDKALHYLTLAANQDEVEAQYNLGFIYYKEHYVAHDIYKAIHYFELAAKQNYKYSNAILGHIYSGCGNITPDIKKALKYLNLGAKQNDPLALCRLGYLYFTGQYIKKDITKAIYYFTLAAEQNHLGSQIFLGYLYLIGEYVSFDLNKSIRYLQLASNRNNNVAQFFLGILHYCGCFITKNVSKGIYLLKLSSKNGFAPASFHLGCIYHLGENVDCNIHESIHYYKKASSMNDNHAKNNLGVIYKNGFGKEIKSNISYAIELFIEAIKRKNDVLSMYNLSNIYFYNETIEKDKTKIIKLLIKSIQNGFHQSIPLLCLTSIKIYGFDIDKIKEEIEKYSNTSYKLSKNICHNILLMKLNEYYIFEQYYEHYKHVCFLYDHFSKILSLDDINRIKIIHKSKAKKINAAFYEGFGFEIK